MDKWKHIREELRCHSTTYETLNNIGETIKRFPEFDLDCLSKGQLLSKLWVVDELKKVDRHLGKVHMYCGWYAILADMIFSNLKVNRIKSFDIDRSCQKIADEININHVIAEKFKAETANILKLKPNADTIINLSCEHLSNDEWFNRISEGTLVILQSNNFDKIKDHINCSSSIEEMAFKYPMSQFLYAGDLDLIDYKRFMLIGIK